MPTWPTITDGVTVLAKSVFDSIKSYIDDSLSPLATTEVRVLEPPASGTNYTALKSQAMAGNVTYTFPAADGSSGQLLSTNGSGALSWATVSSSVGLSQDLRGLQLCTSPNADVAATTVSLIKADELTMDDGTRVASWGGLSGPLTAAITSSGAGGLDTGTEQASTWYEIYAIRKSSDGTKNLLLHRAKDYFLDESQTTVVSTRSVRDTSSRTQVGQTLDTDESGLIEIIDVPLAKVGTPTGRIWIERRATSAGAPTGAAIDTSDKIDVALLSTSMQWVRFVFRNPTSAVAGTTYAISVTGDYAVNASNYVNWYRDTTGSYAAGEVYDYNGSAWASVGAGLDMAFKVYVTRNDLDIASYLPTGYDQKCRIGWVYNDGSSNFVKMSAIDRHVRTALSEIASTSATTPALTDASAGWLPPCPVAVEVWGVFTATGGDLNVGPVDNGFRAANTADNTGTNMLRTTLRTTAASQAAMMGVILTEYQAVYISVSAGTARPYLSAYTW